jgi:pimeloyl-ACP methyl ester carboxylesterase
MIRRLAGAAMLLVVAGCVHTRDITDAQGRIVPGSIATMEMVTIGGIGQSLWFRGVSDANPPLILLHGGPGASESALFRRFNAELEQHFLLVYWEQRGAGRSFHSDIPPESMTIEQLLSDLNEVVELVRRRFHQERVVLLGHSWGTILGTMYAHRHPQKVAAYVGVAQIADNRSARGCPTSSHSGKRASGATSARSKNCGPSDRRSIPWMRGSHSAAG